MTTSLQRQLTLQSETSEPTSRRSLSLTPTAKLGVELGGLSDVPAESPAASPSMSSLEQEDRMPTGGGSPGGARPPRSSPAVARAPSQAA
eukprot:CAMPEP_0115450972 /NCGR_PEP_ID=MMETSP0271-20121206/41821_1 /TAXON_ID=71861 /ORGANISM="Scrippsiella trochoidea, Strain CCMP3099" /LENGTH=89 /DNA_ID=CAMNT_0002877219 /DNA_START=14 /DNA_END=280 /DNA_ORIENTATION=+